MWIHDLLKDRQQCVVVIGTQSSNRTLGFLKRNLKVQSPLLKEKNYKAILRPKLEYCSAIWDPSKGVDKEGSYKVEMVQRRAA